MSVTASTIKKFAPELECENSTRINMAISMAKNCVNESIFGCKYEDAVALLACHMLTLMNRSGSGGAISTEKVGDLQVSYSNPSSVEESKYCTTAYGTLFWQLMTTVRPGPMVLGC